jgi:hypothetical protein
MAEFAAQRQIHRKYLYEMLIRVKRILEKEPTMLELQVLVLVAQVVSVAGVVSVRDGMCALTRSGS